MRDRLRRIFAIVLTLACLAAVTLQPAPATATADGTRTNRALLIGVDDFVSEPSTYPSSTNNVFAMQAVLQESADPFASIVIPETPVTDTEGLTALIRDTFAGSDADDACYLYIRTHGIYDPDHNVEPALLLSDGVKEGQLTPQALQEAFDGIAGTKVLLLDACYSGAFIGKGMRAQPRDLCFLGKDFKVLTSSGAMEESWYWNASADGSATAGGMQGAFYFTQMLTQSLSPRCGSPADANRDGQITLKELYTSLLHNHATSTPQVYPQEDDFVVFTYNPADETALDPSVRSPIGDVTFSKSTLSQSDNQLTLEFVANRPVRVAYQIVYRREDKWRFDEAQLLYDDVERYTAYGDEQGAITPGRKVRTLTLNLENAGTSGYVLVQVVSIDNGELTVHAGQVIAVPPSDGDPDLSVETVNVFSVGGPRELPIFIRHACPCELSVTIVNEEGQTVRKLCYRQSTRPLKIVPNGSTFYWNGCDRNGTAVPAGKYRIHVTCFLGKQTFTADSNTITVRSVDA